MKRIVSGIVKTIKYIFYGYLAIMLMIGLFGSIASYFGNDDKPIKTADGFTIEDYQVVLEVKQDNKINVKENITVDWNEKYHHGIVRFIPRWLEYTGKDGKTIKRKSNVLDLKSINDPYELDVVKKKDRIRMYL